MIITITFNPAIDLSITNDEKVFDIGGKGINVSKVLKSLDCDSLALGFVGKDNKNLVVEKLDQLGIEHDFIEVDGKVRTNTKYIIDEKLIEKNEDGPFIPDNKINELMNKLQSFNNEIVVISGSAPSNVRRSIYREIIDLLKRNNNYVILDCDKDLLRNGIEAIPDMIKPNRKEISELFDDNYDEKHIISEIRKTGIPLTVISKGSQGALFIYQDEVYESEALQVRYVSALSAGDAMVAAAAFAKNNGYNRTETIKLMMAAASASVETKGSKAPNYDRIKELMKEVTIRKVSKFD